MDGTSTRQPCSTQNKVRWPRTASISLASPARWLGGRCPASTDTSSRATRKHTCQLYLPSHRRQPVRCGHGVAVERQPVTSELPPLKGDMLEVLDSTHHTTGHRSASASKCLGSADSTYKAESTKTAKEPGRDRLVRAMRRRGLSLRSLHCACAAAVPDWPIILD